MTWRSLFKCFGRKDNKVAPVKGYVMEVTMVVETSDQEALDKVRHKAVNLIHRQKAGTSGLVRISPLVAQKQVDVWKWVVQPNEEWERVVSLEDEEGDFNGRSKENTELSSLEGPKDSPSSGLKQKRKSNDGCMFLQDLEDSECAFAADRGPQATLKEPGKQGPLSVEDEDASKIIEYLEEKRYLQGLDDSEMPEEERVILKDLELNGGELQGPSLELVKAIIWSKLQHRARPRQAMDGG